MATLDVIYRIAADISKLESGVNQGAASLKKMETGFDRVQSLASTAGKAMAAAFTVTAVVAAGKQVVDYAGHVTDLSARLKMSTSDIQRFEAAFAPAGVSIDQVAKATGELSARIIGGDKSAVGALEKMGLSVGKLKQMKPEERFIAVADAVGSLQDAGEQMYASKTLFGKSGTELLSALDGHLEETIKQFDAMGLVINEQTIKAADDFGDQLGMMGKQLMAIVATIVGPLLPALTAIGQSLMWVGANVIQPVLNVAIKGAITMFVSLWQTISGMLSKLAELGSRLPGVGNKFRELSEWLKRSSISSEQYLNALWTETKAGGPAIDAVKPKIIGLGKELAEVDKEAEKAAKRLKDLNKTLADHTSALAPTTFGTRQFTDALLHEDPVVHNLDVRLQSLTTELKAWGQELPGVTRYMYDWQAAHEEATQIMERQLDTLTVMPGAYTGVRVAMESADDENHKLLSSLSAVEDVLGGIQTAWANMAVVAVRTIQTVASRLATGDILGAMAAGISGGVQLIGKLFGRNEEAVKVSPERDRFFAAAGGLAAYHKQLVSTLGVQGEFLTRQILSAKTMKQFQDATDAAERALDAHNERIEEARRLVDSLGGSLNSIVSGAVKETADQLQDLGIIAVASVGAALEAGYSLGQAVAMNHEGLSQLRDAYADLGLAIDDSFLKELLLQDAIVTNNPKLLEAVGALSSTMDTLAKLGLLNADAFGAMERTGLAMYTKLQAEAANAGGTIRDALLPMQDFLHQAEKRAKELGIPLDENTQMLIDQSKELGIWKDVGKSATDRIAEGLENLIRKMDQFIDRIGRAGRDLSNLAPPDMATIAPAIPMADGGFGRVTKPTLFLAGESGSEEFAFSGGGRRFGGSNSGSSVQINIYGGSYDTPTGRQRLMDQVSRAVMEDQRRLRKLNAA